MGHRTTGEKSRELHCISSQISLVTCNGENLETFAKRSPISVGFEAGLGVTQREETVQSKQHGIGGDGQMVYPIS